MVNLKKKSVTDGEYLGDDILASGDDGSRFVVGGDDQALMDSRDLRAVEECTFRTLVSAFLPSKGQISDRSWTETELKTQLGLG